MAGVPIIIHTPHGHVFYGHFGKISSTVYLAVERLMDRITDITVALTQEERDDYIRLNVSPAQKLRRVHSGVDIDRFQNLSIDSQATRKTFGCSDGDRVVAIVGWLLPIKGPDILLAAMEEVWRDLPETMLLFIGKGDMEAGLRQRLAQIGKTDRTQFTGWRDDMPEILQAIDILVMPSRNEGMGRVAVEAMAAGKPVIASRVGGLKDLVEHENTGLLFPVGDIRALAQSIIRLLDDPEKAEEFGQAGLRCCRKYSSARMIEKLDALYREQLQAHGLIDSPYTVAEGNP
jgi:glycosyltransferase involved in cell wall biosynthesis